MSFWTINYVSLENDMSKNFLLQFVRPIWKNTVTKFSVCDTKAVKMEYYIFHIFSCIIFLHIFNKPAKYT